MSENSQAVVAPVEASVRPEAWALKLAEVPIVSRGMGWQSNATATLREAAAELERLRAREAALLDVGMMLKRCAWALRRGTAPDLGERALYLLEKHGLAGSPLRDETLDEAGAAGAALYDRWTGKAYAELTGTLRREKNDAP